MPEQDIDFSLPENWHIKTGQQPKRILYIEPFKEVEHVVEKEALSTLAQYLPDTTSNAGLATHISANGEYFYQQAYDQWNLHYAEVMNSLRMKLVKIDGQYQLIDDELDRNLDPANPEYWHITKWKVVPGEAPSQQAKDLADGEKWFFFDHVTWQILLDYPEGKKPFVVETVYAWPIYR